MHNITTFFLLLPKSKRTPLMDEESRREMAIWWTFGQLRGFCRGQAAHAVKANGSRKSLVILCCAAMLAGSKGETWQSFLSRVQQAAIESHNKPQSRRVK